MKRAYNIIIFIIFSYNIANAKEVVVFCDIDYIIQNSTAGKDFSAKLEIKNKSKARIIRDGAVVYNGEITSIFREKNQVKEVTTGLECGISLKDFLDFKEKDIIETYSAEKIERKI